MSAALPLSTSTDSSTALYVITPAQAPEPTPITKFCPLCQCRKPLAEFQSDRRNKRDGHRWYCSEHHIERAAYGSLAAKANAERYQEAQHEISLENKFLHLSQTLIRINETADAQQLLLQRRLTPQDWFMKFRVAVAQAAEKARLLLQIGKWTLQEALKAIRNDLDTLWNDVRRLKNDVLWYKSNRAMGERALAFWEKNWRYIGGLAG